MATKMKFLTDGKNGEVFYPFAYIGGVITEDGGTLEAALDNKASKVEVNELASSMSEKAPLQSPTLIGVPKAPTASTQTSTTQIATTQFVQQEIDRRASDFSFTVGSGNFVLATVESLTSIL